jgi:U3 small nucleolar RNA-associated protein 22
VPFPMPLPTEDTNWKVAFEPPTDLTLVGSWANNLSVKGRDGKRFIIDVAVEMPNVSTDQKPL